MNEKLTIGDYIRVFLLFIACIMFIGGIIFIGYSYFNFSSSPVVKDEKIIPEHVNQPAQNLKREIVLNRDVINNSIPENTNYINQTTNNSLPEINESDVISFGQHKNLINYSGYGYNHGGKRE